MIHCIAVLYMHLFVKERKSETEVVKGGRTERIAQRWREAEMQKDEWCRGRERKLRSDSGVKHEKLTARLLL